MLSEIFGLIEIPQVQPRYNIAPTQQIAIVRADATRQNRLDFVKWGFIPRWNKDPKMLNHGWINAKSETVAEKPSFSSAIRHHRCLVPSSGFYEWKSEATGKTPFLVRMKSESLMTFAGIWDAWKNADGEIVETCAILTTSTESNPLMNQLHERMPVILHPGEFDLWLDRDVTDPTKLKSLFKPFPADTMEVFEVSAAVSNPRNDTPDLFLPIHH